MAKIQSIDLFVLAWFVACWAGYTYFAVRKSSTSASLVAAMRLYRREWFNRVLQHENRIADVAALNNLLSSATFFASTTILILGGWLQCWVPRIALWTWLPGCPLHDRSLCSFRASTSSF